MVHNRNLLWSFMCRNIREKTSNYFLIGAESLNNKSCFELDDTCVSTQNFLKESISHYRFQSHKQSHQKRMFEGCFIVLRLNLLCWNIETLLIWSSKSKWCSGEGNGYSLMRPCCHKVETSML